MPLVKNVGGSNACDGQRQGQGNLDFLPNARIQFHRSKVSKRQVPSRPTGAPSGAGAIIARMKSSYRGVPILLATFVVGVTCMGQAARAQAAAPSDDAQALVKQGQKLNSEGKQDEALKLYKQALEKSPNSYEAHLESGVALDLKGDYAAAREHLEESDRCGSGGPEESRAASDGIFVCVREQFRPKRRNTRSRCLTR